MPVRTFKVGDHVTTSGYPGTVTRVCEWTVNMYEVRLASGTVCVCGSDIKGNGHMPTRADFITVYREELAKAVETHPQDYAFPASQVPTVAEKMIRAFDGRSYNKDGRAIQQTCKRLGIRHTYAAINAVLAIPGEEAGQ